MRYRADIDGLRAIAVLFVVFFHAFPGVIRGGFIGVDVFFVISGYLITSIISDEIRRGQFSIINFYQRRIRRIFPALLCVMIAAAGYGWLTLASFEFVSLMRYVSTGAAFVSNFLAYSDTGYFSQSTEEKPLMHLWSLGVEEQFYLIWPVLLLVTPIITDPRGWRGLGALLAADFAFSILQIKINPMAAFYLPFTRLWELFAGGYLSLAAAGAPSSRLSMPARAFAGLALIIMSGLAIRGDANFPGWLALFPVVGAYLVIGSGPDTVLHRRLLSHPWLVYVGLISYPLYLWHWVILSFLRVQGDLLAWPNRIAAIGLSFVLASLTYFLIEKRIRANSDAKVVWGLIICMAAVAVISTLSWWQGWLVRAPNILEQQLIQAYNTEKPYRYRECFLDPLTQGPDSFAKECMPNGEATGSKKLLLLWGDSLAAQLYTGLQPLSARGEFNVAQRTAASCPPGVEVDRTDHGSCDQINEATRNYIIEHKPWAVVLNGRWENGRPPEARIQDIANFLRPAGVEKIIVFGSSADWQPDLKKILLHHYIQNHEFPERLRPPEPFWIKTTKMNDRLREITKRVGIEFISPQDEFCSEGLCLTRVSNDVPDGLVASDHDHLTQQASEYLFQRPRVRELIMERRHNER